VDAFVTVASSMENFPQDEGEDDPLCCAICGKLQTEATAAVHFESCFNESLPVETCTVALQSNANHPTAHLFGQALPYCPLAVIEHILGQLTPTCIGRLSQASRDWSRIDVVTRHYLMLWYQRQLKQLHESMWLEPCACSLSIHRTPLQNASRLECGRTAATLAHDLSLRKVELLVKDLDKKIHVLALESDAGGVLVEVKVGDIYAMLQQVLGVPPHCAMLIWSSRQRALVHHDVPLIAYLSTLRTAGDRSDQVQRIELEFTLSFSQASRGPCLSSSIARWRAHRRRVKTCFDICFK